MPRMSKYIQENIGTSRPKYTNKKLVPFVPLDDNLKNGNYNGKNFGSIVINLILWDKLKIPKSPTTPNL